MFLSSEASRAEGRLRASPEEAGRRVRQTRPEMRRRAQGAGRVDYASPRRTHAGAASATHHPSRSRGWIGFIDFYYFIILLILKICVFYLILLIFNRRSAL